MTCFQNTVKKLLINITKIGDIKKLIPNLGNKTKYVVHYKNLQLYLSLGMKLTMIHRVLRFKQLDWMKSILTLILEKECVLLMILKKTFLS